MASRTVVVVTALLSLAALCVVMTAMGQTIAAVITLIPSIVLGVQQILQAHSQHADARRVADRPMDDDEEQVA
ncbi:hypothetical protein [Streptomyces sp. NPDC087300]|uniref:hypothetical protein n=1 Tax=Streptomyces sp. NPDC087300 TaxID=3365780 RepID=UPI00381436F6